MKKPNKPILKIMGLLGTLLLALINVKCTKTIDVEPLSSSRILEYKITNLPDTAIYGAIDETEKTINIYIPFYYSIAVVDPEIKVSEGATIEEEILPISIGESTTYTIKSKNGTKSTYIAKVIPQLGPKLILEEFSTATTTKIYKPNSSGLSVVGNFYTLNRNQVETYLISEKDGKEIPFQSPPSSTTNETKSIVDGKLRYTFNQFIPATIDTGLYKIKAKCFGQTAISQYPIKISYVAPSFVALTREVKQGSNITFSAPQEYVLINIKSLSINLNGTVYPLKIVSSNTTEITFTIPNDFPVGTNYVSYIMEFNGWPTVSKSALLTVY